MEIINPNEEKARHDDNGQIDKTEIEVKTSADSMLSQFFKNPSDLR